MQRDDRKVALVRQWLELAEEDLASAERLLQPEPIVRGASYHCQQAMEKALKGYLTWHQVNFPWTHNLEQLVMLCEKLDPGFQKVMPAAEFLSPFATVPRYPADNVLITIDDAQHAITMTNKALAFVRSRLPEEVQR